MVALCERYGTDTVQASIKEMYVRSETLARQAAAAIPDGSYTAETDMDDDGVDVGKPVPIKVSVNVEGDRMTIDLSEVSPQVAGYFNSGITAGRSAAQVAFKHGPSELTEAADVACARVQTHYMGRHVSDWPKAAPCWRPSPPESRASTRHPRADVRPGRLCRPGAGSSTSSSPTFPRRQAVDGSPRASMPCRMRCSVP